MRFKTLSLIAVVFLAIGCRENRTLPPTNNIKVSDRLVVLHPENAELWVNGMRRSRWFTELVNPQFSIAKNSDVKSTDEKIPPFLIATANQNEDRGDHYKSGLENISRRMDEYFGQFFIVNTKERQFMVCVYSHVESSGVRSDQIEHYNFVPWVADGNGANFLVYLDMATNDFEHFHINGSQAGPFGDYPN